MSLSLNPFSSVLSSAKKAVSSVTNQFGGGFGDSMNAGMRGLEDKVKNLGGGLGSPFNGLTAGGFGDIGTALKGIGSITNIAGDIGRSINSVGIGGAIGALGGLASSISSGAGQLNNVLSLFRGKNLPASGELFEQRGSFVELQSGNAEDWRVRINCNFGLFGEGAFSLLQDTNGVVWPYNPSITIATKANYSALDPVHSNYPFQAYKSSSVDDIQISGDFSCETEEDAAYWIQATTFFKASTKMFFGRSTNAGNPPIICNLSGYGPGVLNSIPVVVKQFSVELPEDVNYIKCTSNNFKGGATWVPILSKISVTVAPIYNRSKLRQFSLQEYASGQMSTKGYI
jgi:hypothetical protein